MVMVIVLICVYIVYEDSGIVFVFSKAFWHSDWRSHPLWGGQTH